jgi:hypothetical protein
MPETMNDAELEAVVDRSITKHTQPIDESVRNIELTVATMSGSLEEHKSHVNSQLVSINTSIRENSRQIGELAGVAKNHDADIAELFGQSKGEKKTRLNITPSHLTLMLSLGIGVVVIIGAVVGVDLIGVFK